MDHSSMEACPFDRTNRSRFGQIGSCGSKFITRFQIVYTSGASAIGVPGCPDFACWTASIDSVRMVLMDSCSNCSLFMTPSQRCLPRPLPCPSGANAVLPGCTLPPNKLGPDPKPLPAPQSFRPCTEYSCDRLRLPA